MMRKAFSLLLAGLCLCCAILSCKKSEPLDKPSDNLTYGADGKTPMPTAVDMGIDGLSIKWASFNLGASYPADYGDYYAWGEMAAKESYTEENYTLNTPPSNLTAAGRDVVREKLGGNWRMPTGEELNSLRQMCQLDFEMINGVKMVKFTSRKNQNSIYFPMGGYKRDNSVKEIGRSGYYWASDINDYGEARRTYFLYPTSDDVPYLTIDIFECDGLMIRPVCE